jgi:heme/copper-type cytochrome/quinol oxidase subunit 2
MAKKLNKKTKKEIKHNVFVSLIVTSVLFNLFFIIGLVTYNSTNTLDEQIYAHAYEQFCQDDTNGNNKVAYIEKYENFNGTKEAAASYDIQCQSGEFWPYHAEAFSEYLQDLENTN